MRLKYITFVLENCDTVTVDGKYIGDFYVGKIESEIRRIACNSIIRMDTAKEIAIEIHKDANKEHLEFGCESFKTTVFEALTRYSDITSIQFELEEQYVEDGEVPVKEYYDYLVNWCGESDYENEAQKSYISKPGHLYLVIDKDYNIEDYFDKEEIDNNETMNFHFDMCDVDDKEDKIQCDSKEFTAMLEGKTVEQIIEEYGIPLNKMSEMIDKLNEIPN